MPATNDEWARGYINGQRHVITAIRELLENSENRISIISILALLDKYEGDIEKLRESLNASK